MIPINLLINYLVINTQNVHPLINQIVHRTSALRGTTVTLPRNRWHLPVQLSWQLTLTWLSKLLPGTRQPRERGHSLVPCSNSRSAADKVTWNQRISRWIAIVYGSNLCESDYFLRIGWFYANRMILYKSVNFFANRMILCE